MIVTTARRLATEYCNSHVQTYKAQLVGVATVIEQHLTNTPCSPTIDTTLNMG